MIYDVIQRLTGRERIKKRIGPAVARTAGAAVLDVGAGTGTMRSLVDPSARYVWLDSDPRKLDGYATTSPDGEVVLSNAVRIALKDHSVDTVVCSALSHHLDDAAFSELVEELHRVVRDRVLFLDAVRTRSPVGATLWQLDRGAHPRSADEMLAVFAPRFELVTADRFTILHRYLFAVLRRRDES